jgi:hypothetical protein
MRNIWMSRLGRASTILAITGIAIAATGAGAEAANGYWDHWGGYHQYYGHPYWSHRYYNGYYGYAPRYYGGYYGPPAVAYAQPYYYGPPSLNFNLAIP